MEPSELRHRKQAAATSTSSSSSSSGPTGSPTPAPGERASDGSTDKGLGSETPEQVALRRQQRAERKAARDLRRRELAVRQRRLLIIIIATVGTCVGIYAAQVSGILSLPWSASPDPHVYTPGGADGPWPSATDGVAKENATNSTSASGSRKDKKGSRPTWVEEDDTSDYTPPVSRIEQFISLVKRGKITKIKLLIDEMPLGNYTRDGRTSLCEAVVHGRAKTVQVLYLSPFPYQSPFPSHLISPSLSIYRFSFCLNIMSIFHNVVASLQCAGGSA